jgi:hypothetical protein
MRLRSGIFIVARKPPVSERKPAPSPRKHRGGCEHASCDNESCPDAAVANHGTRGSGGAVVASVPAATLTLWCCIDATPDVADAIGIARHRVAQPSHSGFNAFVPRCVNGLRTAIACLFPTDSLKLPKIAQ